MPNKIEQATIQKLLSKNIYFSVAAGNHSLNLDESCKSFPACYKFSSKYFRVVGNGQTNNIRFYLTNYGKIVTDWRDGMNQKGLFGGTFSGTSQATARKTSELVEKEEK